LIHPAQTLGETCDKSFPTRQTLLEGNHTLFDRFRTKINEVGIQIAVRGIDSLPPPKDFTAELFGFSCGAGVCHEDRICDRCNEQVSVNRHLSRGAVLLSFEWRQEKHSPLGYCGLELSAHSNSFQASGWANDYPPRSSKEDIEAFAFDGGMEPPDNSHALVP